MTAPVLRVRMASGAAWDDPSEDLLFELLADIDRGDEQSMRVERLDDEAHVSVCVERSDGGEWSAALDPDDGHGTPRTWVDLREAHAWLTRWAFRIEAAPEVERRSAFGVGLVVYQHQARRFVVDDIARLQQLPAKGRSEGSAGIVIVFHVPGHKFEGVRVGGFERKTGTLGIDVSVPESLMTSETSDFLRSTLELALEKAEAYIASRKLSVRLDEARGAIREAVAWLPATPLPEVDRFRVIPLATAPGGPIRAQVELDAAGRDVRRVEVFTDGRMDYAIRAIETGATRLDATPLGDRPPAEEGVALSEAEFEAIWKRAIGQPSPRGPLRVIDQGSDALG